MSNYEILKEKIQSAIPRLKELTDGCIISKPHFNFFSQKIDPSMFEDYHILNGNVYDEFSLEIICKVSDIEKEFILSECKYGKEPMLNDVLEWLKILSQEMYGDTDLRLYNHFVIHFLGTWNLSSPYLKDQNITMSDRLIVLYDGVS